VKKLWYIHNCVDTLVVEMLLKAIMDYVGILSIEFMTKIQYIAKSKTKIKIMLEY
jgi:hypothetical protein